MMENSHVVRQSLYELYEVMQEIASTKGGRQLFSSQICHRLRFDREEVKACLELVTYEQSTQQVEETGAVEVKTESKPEAQVKKKEEKLTSCVAAIQDSNQVKKYYEEEMYKLFDPKVEKAVKDKLKKKLTINDLRYLYSILSPVEIRGKKAKQYWLQLFKDYFDAEARTEGMNKKLRGR